MSILSKLTEVRAIFPTVNADGNPTGRISCAICGKSVVRRDEPLAHFQTMSEIGSKAHTDKLTEYRKLNTPALSVVKAAGSTKPKK